MFRDALYPPMVLMANLLMLSSCDTGQTQPAVCGDGIVHTSEQCDDANQNDGDGCNATCGVEIAPPDCTTLTESPTFSQVLSVLVTDDDHVLAVGDTEGADSVWHRWIASFDTEGNQHWKLDYEGPLSALRPADGRFAFIHANDENRNAKVISLDEDGNATMLHSLPYDDPELGWAMDLADIDDGLLVSGFRNEDLWLAKLRQDGSVSTLISEDHAGFQDEFVELRRHGDTIMALAQVGVANHSDGDLIEFDTRDTWLIEYDQQGNELRKTVLSSGDDKISIGGNAIDVGPDGTWYVVGNKLGLGGVDLGELGWAAAVRDGEVLWTFESPGSVEPKGRPFAAYHGLAIGSDDVMFVGRVGSTDGVRRWAMRLDSQTGEVVAEWVGEPVGAGEADVYMDADTMTDGRAWLVGNTNTADGGEQWLCNVQL